MKQVVVDALNLDIGALLALGAIASGFFWRLMNRVEKKVDHIIDKMVCKDDCLRRHDRMEQDFNTHYHIPDDGVGVIKR